MLKGFSGFPHIYMILWSVNILRTGFMIKGYWYMIYTIYYILIVSSQLGGLGGLCDCAVILKFHAFDWRPTTKSTKSTRCSQVTGMPEKPWLVSMFKQRVLLRLRKQTKNKTNFRRKQKTTQEDNKNTETHKFAASERPTCTNFSQHQGAHPILGISTGKWGIRICGIARYVNQQIPTL